MSPLEAKNLKGFCVRCSPCRPSPDVTVGSDDRSEEQRTQGKEKGSEEGKT